MKATHINDGEKITKIRVDFWISKEDIIVAIDTLLLMDVKITKETIS